MRTATVAWCALLGFCIAASGAFWPVAAQQPVPAPAASQSDAPQTQPAQQGRARGAARAGEPRRRTTYAGCNRSAHQRNLRGGARRRFLVRCKLGYERPRTPQAGQGQGSQGQAGQGHSSQGHGGQGQATQQGGPPQPAPARQP